MRLVALFSVLTFIALATQTIAARWLPLSALVPDFVLILAVDLGLHHRRALAPILAFAMGYAMDALGGAQLGLNAFMVTFIYLLAYEVGKLTTATGVRGGAVLVMVAVLLHNVGALLLSAQLNGPGQVAAVMPAAMLQAIITALLAPPTFALTASAKRLIGLTQQRGARGFVSRGV